MALNIFTFIIIFFKNDSKQNERQLCQTFYVLKWTHQTHMGSSCLVSVLSWAELVLSHLPAVVTSVRHFTLVTASDRNGRRRHQSQVTPLKRHPEPSGKHSPCRPSLLAELSNLKPSMTKVSDVSSLVIWQSCWICQQQQQQAHFTQLHTGKRNKEQPHFYYGINKIPQERPIVVEK